MKVLFTADVHLHDYRNYNLFDDPKFRLNQYDKLADKIVKIAKAHGAKVIMIAGDFFHVANPLPYVQNRGFRFLSKIAEPEEIDEVLVTHGQHDFDSRTLMSKDNTILQLASELDKVRYMHRQAVTLGGASFYFQGWTPEQDFTHIQPGQYDVLVGHATISNSHINQYDHVLEHGQDIESDKFKWCMFGDIHYHQVVGNQVAIGVPIQSNFNDHPDVGVIIYDTDTHEWYRVSTIDEECQFLRFIISDQESTDPYVIHKSPVRHQKAKKQILHKSINVVELVETLVKQHGLSTIHSEILNSTTRAVSKDVSLMFKIEEVTATNFRSVESLTYTPVNGVKVVRGHNGAGKSTLFAILAYVLKNRGDARSLVTDGQSRMMASVTLMYEGVRYTIRRGWDGGGSLELLQNDVAVESENKRATEAKIIECLPFLDNFDLIYHDQDRPKFLTNYNYSARVDLINRALDLNIVENYKAVSDRKVETLNKSLSETKGRRQGHASVLEATDGMVFDDLDLDYTVEQDQLDKRLLVIKGIKTSIDRALTTESSIKSSELALEAYVGKDFSDADLNFDEEAATSSAALQKAKSDRSQVEKTLNELDVSLRSTARDITTYDNKIASEMLHLEKNKANQCDRCGSDLGVDKVKELHEQITAEIDRLNEKLAASRSSEASLQAQITDAKASLATKNETVAELQRAYDSLSSRQSQVSALRSERDRKLKFEADLEGHRTMFDKLSSMVSTQLTATGFTELASASLTDAKSGLESEEMTISQQKGVLANKITSQDANRKLYANQLKAKTALVEIDSEIGSLEAEIELYSRYSQLMSPKGDIIVSVLKTVSEKLSDDRIQVVAHKTLASGETRPDFNLIMNVAGKWLPYDNLSGGQKVLCDIFIIRHLINMSGGIGALIFDESLKELDAENLEYAVEYLKQIETHDMFIISHVDNFPYFDSTVSAKMTDGRTEYTIM